MFIFAGFLSLDVVCYIWDQYILSMKLPSFHCIATFSAVMLMLLRGDILTCRNVSLKGLIKIVTSRKLWHPMQYFITYYHRQAFRSLTFR